MTESIDDILDALEQPRRAPLALETPRTDGPAETEEAPESGPLDVGQAILECLGTTPVEVDEIVRRCQVTAAEAQTMLLELELAGRIERHSGNKFSLI